MFFCHFLIFGIVRLYISFSFQLVFLVRYSKLYQLVAKAMLFLFLVKVFIKYILFCFSLLKHQTCFLIGLVLVDDNNTAVHNECSYNLTTNLTWFPKLTSVAVMMSCSHAFYPVDSPCLYSIEQGTQRGRPLASFTLLPGHKMRRKPLRNKYPIKRPCLSQQNMPA